MTIFRLRWRAQRRQFRQREQEADERDRRLEEQQLAAVSQASEAFLAQQEEMFAGMGKGELKIGGEEGGPAVKLSFASAAASKAKPVSAHPRAPVLLSGDDDEDGKKKRALIPLTYSDDEDDESTTTPAQRRRKIEAKVPKEKDKLFALPLEWTALNEVRPSSSCPVLTRLRPCTFLTSQLTRLVPFAGRAQT